ncbi:hypothetical protein [Aureimonas phyllosphaerae]|uniref:Uncharacterized protein n=1 Tax=Aureimonas phyllosphaerae TaxID=1166078 RepID=A0A7W6FW97_9HYPH|nr:hypothetical protein [Aureimonas phyllosphaerae]MBB3938099.1 hypothetical protein [Aureimonas phyllosphaerae]MBB3962106.1 hypothetical protein [Aureimonas phyllosphaerae]SFF55953.1 hypothetical protein SAMN05216566_12821 [Aureimonas phyllosphaerae]
MTPKQELRLNEILFAVFVAAAALLMWAVFSKEAEAAEGAVHYRLDYRPPVVPVVSPPPAPEPVPVTPTPTPTPTPVPPTPTPADPTVPVFPENAIKVEYEKKCSFNVVKLDPGSYESGLLVSVKLDFLWTDANAKTANKWLYTHVAGDCVAKGREVGYRYSWVNNNATKFANAYAATGRATAVVRDNALYVTVREPIWISGEIAQGIALVRE